MSYFTMNSIIGASISENDLNEEQKLILKAYNDVKALNIFPASDFEHIDLADCSHFYKWCVEVLTANFWGFFSVF